MPELPEVEIVKRGLEKALLGKVIEKAEITRHDLRVPIPKNFSDVIAHKRLQKIRRRGKYIILNFDESACAVLHLGMSGRIFIHPEGAPKERFKHDHVFLRADDNTYVVFNDPRRFGMLYLAPANDWHNQKPFSQMGPEPLGNNFSGPSLQEKLEHKKSSIKAALLDQTVVAGLGNIYVCEALYDSGIHPMRMACDLSAEELDALAQAIKNILAKAIEAGGSTLRDYKHTDGSLGYFQYQFSVYDREGHVCPNCDCGSEVKKIVQAGRSTFYCEEKQK